jgi:hypothetical protein
VGTQKYDCSKKTITKIGVRMRILRTVTGLLHLQIITVARPSAPTMLDVELN